MDKKFQPKSNKGWWDCKDKKKSSNQNQTRDDEIAKLNDIVTHACMQHTHEEEK